MSDAEGLTPEWSDHRGKTRIKPKPDQQREWAPRQHNYSIQDIDFILTSLTVHSGGKPAQPDVESAARGRDSNFAKKKFFLGAGTAKLKIL